jgi:hypothetical protein
MAFTRYMPARRAARLLLGAKDMRQPPKIPGMQQATSHAQRLEVKRTPYPTAVIAIKETMPEGMFSSAAFLGAKPKFLMRVAEYVVTTPLDIEI